MRKSQALKIMRHWFRMNQPPNVPHDLRDDLPQIVGRCLREAPGDFNRVCEILRDQFDVEMEPDELQAFMMIVINAAQVRARCKDRKWKVVTKQTKRARRRIRKPRPPSLEFPWCDGCRRRWYWRLPRGDKNGVNMGPILHDATWAKIANEKEALCAECMSQRVKDRGISLSLADLLPCGFNLSGWPHSWFNLFLGGEASPVVVDDEWIVAWLNRKGPWG